MGEPTRLEILETEAILKEAYDLKILDAPATIKDPLWWDFPTIPPSFIRALEEENRTPQRLDRITDQLDDPGRDTRRVLYQDSCYLWTEAQVAPWGLNTGYEIARFKAAPDEVGIVKSVSTYLGVEPNEGGDPLVWDPYDPLTLQHNGVNGYFLLRLYQNTFRPMPPVDAGIPAALIPGYSFPELSRWDDYRFCWGRNNTEVFFIVPSNHALRLYFVPVLIDISLLLKEVMGRLVGFTQPIDTIPAAKNVVYAW